MKYGQREFGEAVILDLKGKLSGGPEAEDFRNLFKTLVQEDKKKIIINLKDVEWISSNGIGILMRGFKTVREAGGTFVLIHVGERTKHVFNVMRLYLIFKILGTEEEALKYLSESE